jgi:transposase-like protein
MDGRVGYSEEIRVQASELFASGYGARTVARYLVLPMSTMRVWEDSFRQGHLLNSGAVRENKIYPQHLKVAAVEKFLAGTPKSQILLEYEISTRSLFNKWVAAYRKDGPEGLVAKTKGPKPSVVGTESLEQKIYRLEMENALLKKFQALMAKEQQARPSKRKQLPH